MTCTPGIPHGGSEEQDDRRSAEPQAIARRWVQLEERTEAHDEDRCREAVDREHRRRPARAAPQSVRGGKAR